MDRHFFQFNDMHHTRLNLFGLRAYFKRPDCRLKFEYSDGSSYLLSYLNDDSRLPDFLRLEEILGTSMLIATGPRV